MGRIITGGIESLLKSTLDELKNDGGLDITVLGDLKNRVPQYRKYFNDNKDKIKFHDGKFMKTFLSSHPWEWPAVISSRIRMRKILKNTDVIIDYKNGLFAKKIKNMPAKKIAFYHGGFDFFTQHHINNGILDMDKIVCLSDSFYNDFAERFPKYADKIRVIYNFAPSDITEKSKAQYSPDGKYFVSVMRMGGGDKDYATLISAFDKFWSDNNRPDVKLYLIGDGKYRPEFERLAQKLPAKNNIIFTGNMPEPYGYMKGSLAHILSSPQEGFGLVILEAIMAGTLNVSSDCKSAPREILMDGEAGLLFPVGDVDALAKIMSDIYNEKIDRKKIMKAAAKGMKRFDKNIIIKQIKNLIAE